MNRAHLIALALLWSLVTLPPIPLSPARNAVKGAAGEHLGEVNFPTSCLSAVQVGIDKGVALLHSFQYQEARQTFAEVLGRDPKCAMAHWGKAMALYQQLWDFPSEKQLKEGHHEIEQAKKLKPQTPREQGFLTVAAAFYQKNARQNHLERKRAYTAALERFRGQIPGDVEIESFYALSLISLAEDDVDMMANLNQAIAILNPLFQHYPDHPGVAHYLIHATDKPELAEQGLAAAHRYATIAPDSPHAIHMPSHIFVRLGLWQDSITSNIASNASGAHAAQMHTAEAHYQMHALDYLSYSYLQSGQESKAMGVTELVGRVVGASDGAKASDRAYLEARTMLELHRWREAAGLEATGVKASSQDSTQWARAIGAARTGQTPEAESAVQELTKLVDKRRNRARKNGYSVTPGKPADLSEAEAWLAFARGKTEQALEELQAAAEREEKTGEESVVIPAREMLADMDLELKRPADALAEYRIVLKNSPNRFDALLGAGRAAQASGDSSGAQSFYVKLTELCPAGADRPELAEAKTILAKK